MLAAKIIAQAIPGVRVTWATGKSPRDLIFHPLEYHIIYLQVVVLRLTDRKTVPVYSTLLYSFIWNQLERGLKGADNAAQTLLCVSMSISCDK